LENNGTVTTRVDYSGNAIFAGNVTAYGSPSDIKLKENIKPLENSLHRVLRLNGVYFDWKENTEQFKMMNMKSDIGFIANQVQEVVSELVREGSDGYLSLRDRGLVALLVEAIKEQQAIIDSQEERLKKLEDLLKNLPI
jgi:Chaperone of endosialidase